MLIIPTQLKGNIGQLLTSLAAGGGCSQIIQQYLVHPVAEFRKVGSMGSMENMGSRGSMGTMGGTGSMGSMRSMLLEHLTGTHRARLSEDISD